jgi:hypothetical protein
MHMLVMAHTSYRASFLIYHDVCATYGNKPPSPGEIQTISQPSEALQQMLAPATMIAGYALELALKCLLTVDRIEFDWEHNCEFLFGLLPQSRQAEVEKLYDEEISRDRMYDSVRQNNPGIDLSIRAALKQSAHTFKVYRYLYETEPGSRKGFSGGAIYLAIRKLLLSLHPEWIDHPISFHQSTFPAR